MSRSIIGALTEKLIPDGKGARLGLTEHIEDNNRVYNFTLSNQDKQDIEAVLDRSNGRRMITSIGDCGAEYR